MINLLIIIDFIFIIMPLLLSIAFLTLLERKVMANIQKRRGPNIVGYWGLLQPIADGLKLLVKEAIIPFNSNKIIFFVSPLIVFFISILNWSFLSIHNYSFNNFEFNVFFIFSFSSLSIYGIVLAGWASNSKYSLLGSLRAICQMLSYELTIFFSLYPIFLTEQSLNLHIIITAQNEIPNIIIYPICAMIFFVSGLAETNRTPFDLPEAEGELVSGYNIEFSSMIFALFFLAEYANILLFSFLFTCFYLSGFIFKFSIIFFCLKLSLISILFIMLRAILPRYRFDQLILIGWLVLLPIALGCFFLFWSYINFILFLWN